MADRKTYYLLPFLVIAISVGGGSIFDAMNKMKISNEKLYSENIDFHSKINSMKEEMKTFQGNIFRLEVEKNYLEQKLTDLELERHFWREKHEFLEKELLFKLLQSQDEEKRNQNFGKYFDDFCILTCQAVTATATSAAKQIAVVKRYIE